jgi:hypothetical protein
MVRAVGVPSGAALCPTTIGLRVCFFLPATLREVSQASCRRQESAWWGSPGRLMGLREFRAGTDRSRRGRLGLTGHAQVCTRPHGLLPQSERSVNPAVRRA